MSGQSTRRSFFEERFNGPEKPQFWQRGGVLIILRAGEGKGEVAILRALGDSPIDSKVKNCAHRRTRDAHRE